MEYLRRFEETNGRGFTNRRSEDRSLIRAIPASRINELKDDFADSFDSIKAGQNELLRLIERNSRLASSFEPDIAMQIGDVYKRLEQMTQRLLQISEYLYDINKSEPNYFHGPVLMMAAAYENELKVRIVGRYIIHLLENGTQTYWAERSNTPLIERGSPQNLTLGNMLWHLTK